MYKLTPVKAYMLERVQDDPACLARMDRILGAIEMSPDDVVCITEENLPEIVEELQRLWPPDDVPSGQAPGYMRPLVFTTMDLNEQRPDLTPLLERCPEGTTLGMLVNVFGHFTLAEDQHPHEKDQKQNMVCWPTYNFGTMYGCPHGCQYCDFGKSGGFIAVGLNLEDYMERVVGPTIEAHPSHSVFRMILNQADLMAFEPEYGLFDLFTRKLAQYENRYGHFHTGGVNVDWLAHLEHRDRLIGVWSTTCETVAREIEPGSGSAVDRIKAARKCEEMGIPVRYKFKPMIPIRNWREEYANIIEQALTLSHPESIGFCVVMWMDYESLADKIDMDLLDPEYVKAARDEREEMKHVRTGPFPHRVRAEIYRHLIKEVRRWDGDIPLYISTESREMWDELKEELGQDPCAYICGCSSVAVPRRRLALHQDFKYSTYSAAPS